MAHDMIALIQKPGPHEQNILSKEKIKLPEIEAHQMLVKVSHAAQNPTDSNYTILTIH
jgi:NADPH:quinone reductase-like Zn-dependent oxidoreductase